VAPHYAVALARQACASSLADLVDGLGCAVRLDVVGRRLHKLGDVAGAWGAIEDRIRPAWREPDPAAAMALAELRHDLAVERALHHLPGRHL
jgi:hypothetical protein